MDHQEISSMSEYAIPLDGIPYFRNSGIIFAQDQAQNRYAVGEVDFERFDDQNFQYVFTPQWGVIDSLPATIFQGIPGLDMSLRLERYYRVNITPYFIVERTPSENREDLWELLDEVGLDYYDRFEWLLRSEATGGTDNLIVRRKRNRKIVLQNLNSLPVDLNPGDQVTVESLNEIADTAVEYRKCLLAILRSGAEIYIQTQNRALSASEKSLLLSVLMTQQLLENKQRKKAQQYGIEKAKEEHKYTGRRKIKVDPLLLEQVKLEFREKKITETEAMMRLGLSSRSTLYRRLKEINK